MSLSELFLTTPIRLLLHAMAGLLSAQQRKTFLADLEFQANLSGNAWLAGLVTKERQLWISHSS